MHATTIGSTITLRYSEQRGQQLVLELLRTGNIRMSSRGSIAKFTSKGVKWTAVREVTLRMAVSGNRILRAEAVVEIQVP